MFNLYKKSLTVSNTQPYILFRFQDKSVTCISTSITISPSAAGWESQINFIDKTMGNSSRKSISPAIVDYSGQNYKEIKEQWVIYELFLVMICITTYLFISSFDLLLFMKFSA